MEKGLIFFPDPYLISTPRDYDLADYDEVYFATEDGTRLHGWWIPGLQDRAVLLWLHGNAGNISYRLDNLRRLYDALPISYFLFDYREYGRSEGTISKAGTFYDARAAYRYLIRTKKIPEDKIILFGRSLGTALAVDLAARHNPLGLILEAAFTSSMDMMRRYFPFGVPPGLMKTKYDSLSIIDRVRCPILFIHGERDQAIPLAMAQALYDQARDPKFFYVVEGSDHNDTYLVGGRTYFDKWKQFLRFCIEQKNIA